MNSHDRRATPRPIAEGKFDAVARHTPSSFTGYLEWDLLSAAQNHCVPPHQFVVPPLGGSVWRHGIGPRPTIPPKGGTTNCAFHCSRASRSDMSNFSSHEQRLVLGSKQNKFGNRSKSGVRYG